MKNSKLFLCFFICSSLIYCQSNDDKGYRPLQVGFDLFPFGYSLPNTLNFENTDLDLNDTMMGEVGASLWYRFNINTAISTGLSYSGDIASNDLGTGAFQIPLTLVHILGSKKNYQMSGNTNISGIVVEFGAYYSFNNRVRTDTDGNVKFDDISQNTIDLIDSSNGENFGGIIKLGWGGFNFMFFVQYKWDITPFVEDLNMDYKRHWFNIGVKLPILGSKAEDIF